MEIELSLLELMRRRRSIRAYSSREVPNEQLERVLRAAALAPSGANQQPWLFGVVTDPEIKASIRTKSEAVDSNWHGEAALWLKNWLAGQNITPDKPFLTDAPCLICVFGNTSRFYWLESAWLAIGYMLLAAEEAGLATLTYTPGNPGFLRELLNVPGEYEPVAILPLGYAAEAPDPVKRARKPLEQVAFRNRY